jgi:hypothetical protein
MDAVSFAPPDSVIRDFFPDQSPISITKHGNGLIHHTVKLVMPSGKYLLQQINRQVFPHPDILALNIQRIHQHLATQATPFQLLEPVYTHRKQAYAISPNQHYWRMFRFIDQAHAIDKVQTEQQAFLAGQAFGSFIFLLRDLAPQHIQEAIPDFHNSLRRWQHFEYILQSDPRQRARLVRAEIQVLQQHHSLFEYIAMLSLPTRLVHNDAKIGNILFSNTTGQALAVTDWDTVMPGTLLADFGDLTRSIINPVAEDHPNIQDVVINIPLFRALCQGFLQALEGILHPIEKENLIKGAQWIVLEQMLRFLTDYIAGDTYYAIHHPDHNLDRARNQAKLFMELLEHEDSLSPCIQC